MNKVKRSFVSVLSCLFLLAASAYAENVTIRDGRMSADLKEASLVGIAKDIENQAGISFKGDESLLEETVSVSFKDLPLEDGIKRILANLNYSLMFDDLGKISTVIIMSEGSGPSASQPQVRSTPVRPASPTPSQRRPVVRRPRPSSSPLVTGQTRSPAAARPRTIPPRARSQTRGARVAPGMPAVSEESNLPDAFRTIENAAAPGGQVGSDEPLPPAFRVIQRAEPPGEGVKGGKETPQASKVQKNVPPPGGAVQSSGEKPGDEEALK